MSRHGLGSAAARSVAGALFLFLPRPALADDTADLDALLSESIVSTPSRSSETATTAPATSSIVTAEDLRRWGIHSLDDAINYLALGMVTTAPLHTVEIGARGVLLTIDYGNHILVLLDGHVLNEPWNGSAYFDRGLAVPFELIDHIEVILGPGSVLYGSEAMLGVIHVVTKRARDHAGWSLSAEGDLAFPTQRSGDLLAPSLSDSYLGRMGRGYRLGAGLGLSFEALGLPGELSLGLEYYRQDGPGFELGPQAYGADAVTGEPKDFGPRGTPGVWGGLAKQAFYTQIPAAYARLFLGDWALSTRGALYRRATPYLDGIINVVGDFDAPDNVEMDRWLDVVLSYQSTLTELVDLSLRGYADYYDYSWRNETSAAEDCLGGVVSGCTQKLLGSASTLGAETQLQLMWLAELRLQTLIGIDSKVRVIASDYDVIDRSTGVALDIQNDHERTDLALAGYVQQGVSPTPWLDLNLGARWDYDERSKSALSPRSALGVSPWEGGRFKLIYSEAFRAPTAYELGYADYTTQISPESLSPETVRSVEGSIEQRFGSQRILFGIFRSWWADMVSYRLLDDQELGQAQAAGLLEPGITEAYVYTNIARIDNYGLNAAFEGTLLEHRLRYGLNLTSAFSRQDPRDGSDPQVLTVGPSLFGNARLSYELTAPWPTLALAVQYQERRLADRAFDGGFAATPSAPPHVELKLTASGNVPHVPGLTYSLSGSYSAARVSPYVIGPWQYAVDETTPYELAPLKRLQLFGGLEYRFGQ